VPGMGEWIVILIIVLLVFGANKLPSIGDALGRSIKNFKRASAGAEDADEADAAPKKAKQVAGGKSAKQIEEGASAKTADDDDEWEEVVVRRKKKKSAAAADEG
jgi:sec-independent protein translocase protein TatA